MEGACLQNIQFQGVETRGREAYLTYDELHLGEDNTEIGGFETRSPYRSSRRSI